jgi:molybdate transport system permease protein
MSGTAGSVLFTLAIAAGATLCILPPGLALAWALARRDWPGKALVETLVTLPLVMPPVATGLLLLKLLGPEGPVGSVLHGIGLPVVFTWRAVLAATAVMAFPLLVRSARSAFEAVDPRYAAVARTLGAGPWRAWWTVTLPLARRGLVGGALLAFARGLGEFGATLMVAGYFIDGQATLALGIYHQLQIGRDGEALVLAGWSVALAFGAVFFGERLGRMSGGGG